MSRMLNNHTYGRREAIINYGFFKGEFSGLTAVAV
jgi:hypothetical protein